MSRRLLVEEVVETPDYILIGSGINSLVCGALLARKGLKVLILEREAEAGGCIKSREVTLPGFNHDLMSGFYPEFIASKGFAELGEELAQHGLEFCNTRSPCAALLSDGRSFVFKTDRNANVAALNELAPGDGDLLNSDLEAFARNAHLSFGLLGNEVLSLSAAKLLGKEAWSHGLDHLSSYFGGALESARTWLGRYQSDEAKACFAPWVLHAGMDIDGAMSGYMARIFAFALEAAGMPVVKGGSSAIVKAFERLIAANGGHLRTGCHVEAIETVAERARGVLLASGERLICKKGVIANVTPTALYGASGLLNGAGLSSGVRREAEAYRYGRGNMIIHLALNCRPQWPTPDLQDAAMIHVCDGIEQITQSLADVRNHQLPARATLAIGQKDAVDPTRSPEGKWSLWIQLHEIPREVRGDAADELDCSKGWTDELREAYADRVLAQLSESITNLPKITLARSVFAPPDLEKLNCNLVGGDPYSGANDIDQFLLWRPLKSLRGHRTPIANVFHIGASTHPGPGLGGGSGYLVGSALK